MADHSVQNWPFSVHVGADTGPAKFVVVGDGRTAPSGSKPANVSRSQRNTPIFRLRGIAQNPISRRLVAGTILPGKTFYYSDDSGTTWTGINAIENFEGAFDRIVWSSELSLFIALSVPGSTKPLAYSADGENWFAVTATNFQLDQYTGYAFDHNLNMFMIAYEGSGDNLLGFNGSAAYSFQTGEPNGGFSLAWDDLSDRMLGFSSATNEIFWTDDYQGWTLLGPTPEPIAGRHTAYSTASGRVLLFCQTVPAVYSDDGGASWEVASGMSENTGSVSRQVAIDGDSVYVAYTAIANRGCISENAGATWEDCFHYSGLPYGVSPIE